MDVYQKEYTKSIKLLSQLEPEKKRMEAEIAEIEALLEEIANKKNELNKLFYHKYSRFI
jgi:predicted  nucleic acid-binding Zn-ribbon protein